MEISKHKVVTIDYTLKNEAGDVLDSSEGQDPLVYLHGANNLIPGLEKALEGKGKDDNVQVVVSPAEAYGERDENKVLSVPREQFPQDTEIQVGMQFGNTVNGQTSIITVVEVGDKEVKVDGNHPLAGVPLHFSVSIKDVRDATDEEKSHGHVHGPGGHQH